MVFTKMEAQGNDYIYVNVIDEHILNANELSKKISDRHFGIGSDGLVLIGKSDVADFKMTMYNSDGSEAEMCGNAVRSIGKYVFEKGLTNKNEFSLSTKAGIKYITLTVKDGKAEFIKVNMGEPIIRPALVPVNFNGEAMINEPVTVDGETYYITAVSMGNPHAVIFCDDVEKIELEKIGPKIENHPLFPNRTNVEFVSVVDEKTLHMRVWERGAGETLACGTGACGSLVAAVLNNKCGRSVTMNVRGGQLLVDFDEATNCVFLAGTATFVFDGSIEI